MYYKSYEIPVYNSRHIELDIGTQYEDGVRELLLDLSKWKDAYGDGNATVLYMQDGSEYAVAREAVLDSSGVLHWVIKKADTASVSGTVVIRYAPFDGGEARSIRLRTTARRSVPVQDGDIPEHDTGWYESILEACDNVMAVKAEIDDLRRDVDEAIGDAANKYFSENPIIETDPTVPNWAKAPEKPEYTYAEVGAMPATYVPPVLSVNGSTGHIVLDASAIGAMPADTHIPDEYDDRPMMWKIATVESTVLSVSNKVDQLTEFVDSLQMWNGGDF